MGFAFLLLRLECPPQAHGPRLTALLGQGVAPLGNGALLEEVGEWVWALRGYSWVSLPVHALLLGRQCEVTSRPPNSCCHVVSTVVE